MLWFFDKLCAVVSVLSTSRNDSHLVDRKEQGFISHFFYSMLLVTKTRTVQISDFFFFYLALGVDLVHLLSLFRNPSPLSSSAFYSFCMKEFVSFLRKCHELEIKRE